MRSSLSHMVQLTQTWNFYPPETRRPFSVVGFFFRDYQQLLQTLPIFDPFMSLHLLFNLTVPLKGLFFCVNFLFVCSRQLCVHISCKIFHSFYTKKAVKCADPRDRKVKRLLRKLQQRQRTKAHRTPWFFRHDNLPVMSEVRFQSFHKYFFCTCSSECSTCADLFALENIWAMLGHSSFIFPLWSSYLFF